jgi:anti-sigma regulatory factor (Ser/Thr protein kinase)
MAVRECVDWAVSASPAETDVDALRLGLTEALTNAVVHGALQISSDGRESDYDSYLAAIESKVSAPVELLPQVQVVLTTTDSAFTVRLDWPGLACPVEKRAPSPTEASSAGFGMALIYSSFDTVEWDDSGRCLKLTTLRPR